VRGLRLLYAAYPHSALHACYLPRPHACCCSKPWLLLLLLLIVRLAIAACHACHPTCHAHAAALHVSTDSCSWACSHQLSHGLLLLL
jgi:hypothetical protein